MKKKDFACFKVWVTGYDRGLLLAANVELLRDCRRYQPPQNELSDLGDAVGSAEGSCPVCHSRLSYTEASDGLLGKATSSFRSTHLEEVVV